MRVCLLCKCIWVFGIIIRVYDVLCSSNLSTVCWSRLFSHMVIYYHTVPQLILYFIAFVELLIFFYILQLSVGWRAYQCCEFSTLNVFLLRFINPQAFHSQQYHQINHTMSKCIFIFIIYHSTKYYNSTHIHTFTKQTSLRDIRYLFVF